MGSNHGKAWEGAGRHGKGLGKVFPWEGLPTGDQPSATLPAFPGKGGEGGFINPIYGLNYSALGFALGFVAKPRKGGPQRGFFPTQGTSGPGPQPESW